MSQARARRATEGETGGAEPRPYAPSASHVPHRTAIRSAPFPSPCETFLRIFTKIQTRKLCRAHISGLFFSVKPWYTDTVMKLSGKPDIAPRSRAVIAKPVRRLVVAIRSPRLGKTDSEPVFTLARNDRYDAARERLPGSDHHERKYPLCKAKTSWASCPSPS
mgnify:CR=1 FL=1